MSRAPVAFPPRRFLAAVLLPLLAAGLVGAQPPANASALVAHAGEPGDEALPSADSVRLLRQARGAQAAFERQRRTLLPTSYGGGVRCDVRIGRFCYWYDEQAPDGPEEPPRIAERRRRLLDALDSAAAELPADEWLVGQRVRYRLEAGDADSAVSVARACAAPAAWCAELRGLALHAAGDAAGADSAFAEARRLLDEPARCRRTDDLAPMLDDALRDRWPALPCAARDSVAERWWWLATPFLSRPGNDRRSEHDARLALARLHAESRTAYAETWRDDLRELIVRYGWPERWSRRPPTATAPTAVSVVGHDPSPAYRFTPRAGAVDAPYDATDADWPLRDPLARERYAPAFARRVHPLPTAAAVLRRGDSLLVVATYEAPLDSLRGATPSLALVLAREGEPAVVRRDTLRRAVGAITATAPDRPHLVALEAFGDSGTAARARLAVRPPPLVDGFGVSDVLLFDADRVGAPPDVRTPAPADGLARGDSTTVADSTVVPEPPPSADSMAARAAAPVVDSTTVDSMPVDSSGSAEAPRPTALAPAVELAQVLAAPLGADVVRAPGSLGVYWELYGLGDGAQAVETSLVVAGEEAGWLERTWDRVRGEPPRAPVRLRWIDAGAGGPLSARSVTVALPALPDGRYDLELAVTDRAGRVATARRTITVRGR